MNSCTFIWHAKTFANLTKFLFSLYFNNFFFCIFSGLRGRFCLPTRRTRTPLRSLPQFRPQCRSGCRRGKKILLLLLLYLLIFLSVRFWGKSILAYFNDFDFVQNQTDTKINFSYFQGRNSATPTERRGSQPSRKASSKSSGSERSAGSGSTRKSSVNDLMTSKYGTPTGGAAGAHHRHSGGYMHSGQRRLSASRHSLASRGSDLWFLPKIHPEKKEKI